MAPVARLVAADRVAPADSFNQACNALGLSIDRAEAAVATQREAIARMAETLADLLPLVRSWVLLAA